MTGNTLTEFMEAQPYDYPKSLLQALSEIR